MKHPPLPAGLRVRARAQWPEPGEEGGPRPIRGFVESSFSPMVAQVAARCLSRGGRLAGTPVAGQRTAVVLVTASGDRATATAVADAVDRGRRVPPMLFFQSVPNSVLGHVAAEWALTGPVTSLSPVTDALSEGLAVVDGLTCDGDATEALLIVADQAPDPAASGTAFALLIEPVHAAYPQKAVDHG